MLRTRILLKIFDWWLGIRYPVEMSSDPTKPCAGDRYKAKNQLDDDPSPYALVWVVMDDYLLVSYGEALVGSEICAVSKEHWLQCVASRKYTPVRRLQAYGEVFWNVVLYHNLPAQYSDVHMIEYRETYNGRPVSSPLGVCDVRRRRFGDIEITVPVRIFPRWDKRSAALAAITACSSLPSLTRAMIGDEHIHNTKNQRCNYEF